MKTLTNLVILAGLAYLGFIFFKSPDLLLLKPSSVAKQPAAGSTQLPRSTTTTSLPEKPQRGFIIPPTDQTVTDGHTLEVVRGKVLSVVPEGLIISCNQAEVYQNWNIHAESSGDSWALANLAIAEEKKRYGDLMMLKNGVLRVADITPDNKADGIILLCDHPSAVRMVDDVNIKVIAAKTDGIFTYGDAGGARRRIAVYKMQFQLGSELKKFVDRLWMEESGNQLRRPNRR